MAQWGGDVGSDRVQHALAGGVCSGMGWRIRACALCSGMGWRIRACAQLCVWRICG